MATVLVDTKVTHATVVPLVAQAGKESDVEKFLVGGYDIVQSEPATLQWYAYKHIGSSPAQFAIFDTFPNEAGRVAHLTGVIPGLLGQHGPNMLASRPDLNTIGCEVLSQKVLRFENETGNKAGLKTGLQVLFTSKPEKREAVKQFLINAIPLVEEEKETVTWYGIHWPGTDKFGVVDFFATDDAREAHLSGKVAAALIGSIEENLTGAPEIVKVEVLAAKI